VNPPAVDAFTNDVHEYLFPLARIETEVSAVSQGYGRPE
jgi:hypothetical protein